MIFFRFHKIVCLISTISFSFAIASESPAQQPQSLGEYETPPNLHAKEVLSPDLISGNRFWVDDLVRSNGYLNIYGLNTDYGYLLANGTSQLKERQQEVAALSELEKFSNSKVFLDASKKAGIDLIMAPVNMAKTVVNAVADPAGTLEKVQKIPAGILGLFGDITDTVQSGFNSVSGAVSNSDSNKESDLESKAKDFAIEKGLDHIGYNKKEAEWYKKLGVDLYTSNPILRDKISTIVKIETAVNIGFDFVPGVGAFGMLGKASKYIKYTDKLALYADPDELKAKNSTILRSMNINKEVADEFLSTHAFSPTLQTIAIDILSQLSNVRGIEDLIKEMNDTKSREGAEAHVRALQFLLSYAKNVSPLKHFISIKNIPAALSVDNEAIVPIPIDYLFWTKEVADELDGYTDEVAINYPYKRIFLQFSGKISTRVRAKLQGKKVVISENVEM